MNQKLSVAECVEIFQGLSPRIIKAYNELAARLSPGHELFLTGGCLVDRIIAQQTGTSFRLHDIDCFVTGTKTDEDFFSIFDTLQPVRNRFGGLKIVDPETNIPMDIWRLENHNWWREPTPNTPAEALAKSTLDISAIAWCPRCDLVVDQGCLEAMASRTIELRHLPKWYQPTGILEIVHILLCVCKYRNVLAAGPRLTDYLGRVLNSPCAKQIMPRFEIKMRANRLPIAEQWAYQQEAAKWFRN